MVTAVWRGLRFAVFFGVYLLLVDQLVTDELVAGAATAVVATIAFETLHAHTQRHFAIRIAWLRRLASLPWSVLKDTATILRAGFGRVPPDGLGRTLAIPFRSQTGLPPAHKAGRRALVLGGISVTPNVFVVLRQRDRDARRQPLPTGSLLVHQLVPRTPAGHGDEVWPL